MPPKKSKAKIKPASRKPRSPIGRAPSLEARFEAFRSDQMDRALDHEIEMDTLRRAVTTLADQVSRFIDMEKTVTVERVSVEKTAEVIPNGHSKLEVIVDVEPEELPASGDATEPSETTDD